MKGHINQAGGYCCPHHGNTCGNHKEYDQKMNKDQIDCVCLQNEDSKPPRPSRPYMVLRQIYNPLRDEVFRTHGVYLMDTSPENEDAWRDASNNLDKFEASLTYEESEIIRFGGK